jgi:hypothetical protein
LAVNGGNMNGQKTVFVSLVKRTASTKNSADKLRIPTSCSVADQVRQTAFVLLAGAF